jgi:hypothetical protein
MELKNKNWTKTEIEKPIYLPINNENTIKKLKKSYRITGYIFNYRNEKKQIDIEIKQGKDLTYFDVSVINNNTGDILYDTFFTTISEAVNFTENFLEIAEVLF